MMVELFPQIRHDALTDKAHEVCLAIVEDSLNEIEPHDDNRDEEEHLHTLVDENFVHCGLDEPGGSSSGKGYEDHTDHGQDELHPVGFKVLQEASV